MSAQVEKLTAALAAAKDAIRTLKAESAALKVKFREELKAAKAGKKSATKKSPSKGKKKKVAAVKVSKALVAKKKQSPRKVKNVAPVSTITAERKVEENITAEQDIFANID